MGLANGFKVLEFPHSQTVNVVGNCPFCGKFARVADIPEGPFSRWMTGGGSIQDELPMLSADQREVLLTGICCFDSAIGPEDEQPEEESL